MSQLIPHQAEAFLNQEGIYREGPMYLCIKLIAVEYTNSSFDFQAEITCDFYFGLKDYAEKEKYAFHEGMPQDWGERKTFSFGGIEVRFSENQINIPYIGYVSFNPQKVALYKQKDPDFFSIY